MKSKPLLLLYLVQLGIIKPAASFTAFGFTFQDLRGQWEKFENKQYYFTTVKDSYAGAAQR